MTARRIRAWLLCLALLGTAGTCAATPEASDEQSLYLRAMQLLSENKPAEAMDLLARVIKLAPQHAGARLELALTYCALGNAAEAERLFREVETLYAPSPAILEVIEAHRRGGCLAWQPKVVKTVTMSFAADSNINQGASSPIFVTGGAQYFLTDDYLPKRDRYSQAAFDYARELDQRGSLAIAQVRLRRHDVNRDLDTAAVLLGYDHVTSLLGWQARTLVTGSMIGLGGQLYQRQLQAQGWVAPPITLPDTVNLILSGAVGHIEYANRAKFDSNTAEVGGLVSWRGKVPAQAGIGYLFDHGEASRPGGDRNGWYANWQLQPTLSPLFGTELSWSRQDWHGSSTYSPGLIDSVRNQSTRQWRAALSLPLAPRHSLLLEWRHVQNKENISLFQYNSQSLQLSWRWSGF